MRNKYVVWSLVVTLLISSLYLAAGPFTFVSASGGANLTLGKTVTASGQSQTYSPNNVKDSNQETYWESSNNAFPQWIQVDLGTETSIDQIVLKLPTGWETRTQTLAVQGSTNGSTFTDIVGSADYVFNPSAGGNTVKIDFSATSTRYVRLNVTGNTGWPAAQVSEFEIYGASTPTPTPTATPTATPTPTVTPTPTAIPTATPTATPVAGSNIAFGKSITASSNTQSFVAANANDNNTNTYWEGGSNPSSLILDLGSNYNVSSIVLKLNPAAAWGARTQTIQVLGHNQNTTTFGNLVSAQSYSFNPASGNTVTIPVTATVKRLQLNITANSGAPAGQIAELEVYGTPAPNPDLVITGMSWSPTNPVESNAITLNAIVKNIGNASSPATTVNFYLNNELVGSAPVGVLATGASTTASMTLTAGVKPAATYSVSAKVDEDNLVIEQNEANNSYTNPASLIIAPVSSSDLVGTVTWTPSNPVANNNVTFNVNLKNQGTVTTASGSHGISVVLKNSAGSTIQTYNGSYNGALAGGASVNVAIPGTWTAINGNYTVTTTVEVDANEIAAKQANNVSVSNLVVYAARGASMPYSRYDTEDATLGGGATLKSAPTFDQALIASEASGQRYIALPSNGSNLEWTVRQGQGGAGVTMRFTMPDSADGMGLNGSLDVYVNGAKVKTVSLTSYYSWQYFSGDMPGDTPSAGRPLFRFDEVHWKMDTPLQPGDKIRIQKNNGDSLEYGVDFIEIESVPTAIARPANSVSVTDYGAVANDGQDDLAAFKATVNAAVASGKSIYIPAGTFNLSSMWEIGSASNMINNLTITGAGLWHTNIQFTNPNAAGGGISLRISGKLDFSNVYMNSNLRSRYGQNAIYKGFMDNFGTNSIIHDVWVEHFECGMWVGDYAHTPAIYATGLVVENSRIRNNLADGINFSQGTSNSIVRNSSVRNNGDDGLAVWTSNTNGAPAGVNNTFSYNTIENNWRAAAIAFFGGSGHKADHNYIIDTVGGSGIRMNTVFPGYHFQNNTGVVFSDTTIINSGTSKDLYGGERGAIDLEASNDAIKNVTFNNIDIINTQRDAIQFGYGGGFENIVFNNININGTGLDGITTSRFSGPHKGAAIYTYTGNGAATFNNLTTSNIAYPNLNYIQSGFNLTIH
ncbi:MULTISPECIES: discoidin domain-containing protein [Paenibacillus]|uniref:discoidin domain-containing protein n=1 Tax=Paenibacillus TaxID=44249 RepID=UPI00096D8365|nr:discoidin domain-containing protein [Paenibacillus odorifer]OME60602.1 glycosyl hydrolase [Paenibacillus odorifer]